MASSTVKKELIMQGYLEKKSPKAVLGVRAWQKRYFELVLLTSSARGNGISLFYHKVETDAGKEPLGEIVLNEIKSVTLRKDKGEGRFDVQVPSRVFALRCENPAELKKWIATLESMSQMANFKKPANLPATPADTMRLMAQNSLSNPSKGNETRFDDAAQTLELMSKGQAFIRYHYEHVTEQTRREIVLLFYKKDSTPLGSLYFCEPGTKTEDVDTALALHTLTDLYLGKQSKAFKSAIASHAESKKCFTAVGSNRNGQGRELSLEGDSKEQVAAWLFGINAILTHKGGRKVMTAEDSEKEEARKRAVIAAKAAEAKAAEEAQLAEQRALEEQQRLAVEAQKQAQAEAERANAAAAEEAARNAAEQAAAHSAAEREAAEKRAADALAAAMAATAAALAAKEAAEAAAAAANAAAAERIAAAEKAAAESAAAAAAAEAAAAAAPTSPAVVRIRRKADGSVVPADFTGDFSELSLVDQALASPTLTPLASPSSSSSGLAAVPEETAATWLASLGDAYPGEYLKLFKDNGVDMHFLVGLSSEELQEMGVKNSIHLKKMNLAIEKLRESGRYSAAPKILPTQKEVIIEEPEVVVAAPAAPATTTAAAPVAPVVPTSPTSASADAAAAAAAAADAADAAPAPVVAAPVVVPDSPVGQFLYKLGPAFLVYLKTFEDNGVNLNFLLTLNDDDLEELGVSKLHRKKMVQEIKEYRLQNQHEIVPPSPVTTPSPAPSHSRAPSSVSFSSASVLSPAPSTTTPTAGAGHTRAPSSGGGYLARAAAAKQQQPNAAPIAASSSSGTKDDILASIKEAKAKKRAEAGEAQATTDEIDLAGTSIAAIAQRMAAQREARAKASQA